MVHTSGRTAPGASSVRSWDLSGRRLLGRSRETFEKRDRGPSLFVYPGTCGCFSVLIYLCFLPLYSPYCLKWISSKHHSSSRPRIWVAVYVALPCKTLVPNVATQQRMLRVEPSLFQRTDEFNVDHVGHPELESNIVKLSIYTCLYNPALWEREDDAEQNVCEFPTRRRSGSASAML